MLCASTAASAVECGNGAYTCAFPYSIEEDAPRAGGGGEVTFVLGVWFPGEDTLAITPEAHLSILPTPVLTPS